MVVVVVMKVWNLVKSNIGLGSTNAIETSPSLFSIESVLQTCDFASLFHIIVDCEGNPLEMIACTVYYLF
jgi:hypothetical protein